MLSIEDAAENLTQFSSWSRHVPSKLLSFLSREKILVQRICKIARGTRTSFQIAISAIDLKIERKMTDSDIKRYGNYMIESTVDQHNFNN